MSLMISYDIEDNYLRQKIANHVLDVGLARVQYSVYIGTVREVVVKDLLEWLQKIPDEKRWGQNDSILMLSVSQQQVREMVTIGNPDWDQDDLSGDQHTLIL